ncbi:DUF5313 family protein [Hoyosella rhizosphaerae]|nr:DUF5313 family protein [Hoyosella rhizosphaerae]MBN4927445.1 DUF5313 family protein [Hoyosella rhizosphaerae]
MFPVKPSFGERIRYVSGRSLPPHLHPWVAQDLTGPGATRRYLVRGMLPLIPLLAVFFIIPGPIWVIASMVLLLLIPYAYFLVALTYVYRRHRLLSHGLDPNLLSTREQLRKQQERDDYNHRFGHPPTTEQ